jgi:hypothetical protein
MQLRAMGPGSGWSWLKRGINLGARNPKAIFGAAALLMLVALVPSALQLGAQFGLGLQGGALLGVVGLATLASVVLMPPLVGGFLRIIDATEHGRPAHPTALFDVFKQGQGAGRLIGFGLLMTVIYVVVFALVLRLAFGEGFFDWYWQVMNLATQQHGAIDPHAVPPMPEGMSGHIGRVMAFGIVFVLFIGGVYAIGFGQIALSSRSIGGALVDGVVGAFKNLLPILVLAICSFGLGLLLMIGVGLLVALLAVVGGLVHPALSLLLALPVYLGMLLVIYVVMFGVIYHLWRDVCGEEPPLRNDAVAA